jgi:methyl-accepting chemotaxis protein
MSIRTKIVITGVASLIITAGLLMLVLLVQRGRMREQIVTELDAGARDACARIAQDVLIMARVQEQNCQIKLAGDIRVAQDVLARAGAVTFDPASVMWHATDQATQKTIDIALPRMLVGGQWLGQENRAEAAVPVVDPVRDLTGNSCTLFQRMNTQGDMLRVATNVSNARGERAVGTFIAAGEPDGSANAVIQSVLEGRTFIGRARILGVWHLAAYLPLRDEKHQVVGMLYTGVPEESVRAAREGIMSVKVGKTGYVFVLGGRGMERGRYIVSANGKRDGENIWEATDHDGRKFIQEIVSKGVATGGKTCDFVEYSWKNPEDARARTKLAAVTYFEPWDWVIGAGAYEDDFYDAVARVNEAIEATVQISVGAAIVLCIVAGSIWTLMGRRIARPLGQLVDRLRQIATGDGDLTQRVAMRPQNCSDLTQCGNKGCKCHGKTGKCWEIAGTDALRPEDRTCKLLTSGKHKSCHECKVLRRASRDEVDEVSSWINTFIADVERVMGQVVQSADDVARGAAQIAASSEEMAAGMTQQTRQTDQITDASKEMFDSIMEVAKQATEASRHAQTSQEIAGSGGSVVTQTVQSMTAISQSVISSAQLVRDLGERSRQIGQIVDVINDIADQTNLLALNAAIEAARAGDHGRGFAVVANEVRKLADRTTKATDEIAQSIHSIQAQTTQTVQRMESGSSDVESGVASAREAGRSLESIVAAAEQVRSMVHVIEDLAERQTSAGQTVTQSVEAIAAVSRDTKQATDLAAQAAAELSGKAQNLHELVSRFRTRFTLTQGPTSGPTAQRPTAAAA